MITGMNHITLAVTDIETSFQFYAGILGLKPAAKWKTGAYFTAGDLWFALNQDSAILESKRPDYSHISFTCEQSEFNGLKKRLTEFGCTKWSENESEGESFYFLDPDGHKLEIHVGDLPSRLKEMRDNPWGEFEFFL